MIIRLSMRKTALNREKSALNISKWSKKFSIPKSNFNLFLVMCSFHLKLNENQLGSQFP